MFTPQDNELICQKGLTTPEVEQQIENFRSGFPFLNINRAAQVNDGIRSLSPELAQELACRYEKTAKSGAIKIEKFVPASGAATRMFKDIFGYIDGEHTNKVALKTISEIENFAFVGDLKEAGIDFSDSTKLLSAIVSEPLEYGKLPKGLVKFHSYKDGSRTALEEHLVEGALYGATCCSPVNIHFTVSPEHLELFKTLVTEKAEKYQNKFGVAYNISYSTQKSATDTIAVTPDNEPFRTDAGELLFRPSGHGALLDNLADLSADLIFVKTIDNVQPDHLKTDTLLFKKALAGLAVTLQEEIFAHIRSIDAGDANPETIITFIEENLGFHLGNTTNFEQLRQILNRPLRVCGMVKNEGEPGGGPFWVKNQDGTSSLQIAESSQISPEQIELMKKATHFNPVDLICMPNDINGDKFALKNFRDPKTGFISEKSFQGKPLKAQELPGLWNGAMAKWNTVFVEVPISTFSPVKIITDLLRPEHQ